MNRVAKVLTLLAAFGFGHGAFATETCEYGSVLIADQYGESLECLNAPGQPVVEATPEPAAPESMPPEAVPEEKKIRGFGLAPVLTVHQKELRKEGKLPLQAREIKVLRHHGFNAEAIAQCNQVVQSESRSLGVIKTGDRIEGMASWGRKGLKLISGRYVGEPELTIQCPRQDGKIFEAPLPCGNWKPVTEESVEPAPAPASKPKALASRSVATQPQPEKEEEEECAIYPTAFVAAGFDVGFNGKFASFLSHANLGGHCMKRLNEREQIGVGAQVVVDYSHGAGSWSNEAPGAYDVVRAKAVLPSFRYWGVSEDRQHQYGFLGGPSVGAAYSKGGSNNGSYRLDGLGELTAGLNGGWDMYSKDEETGEFYKDISFGGSIDVVFGTFTSQSSYQGKLLKTPVHSAYLSLAVRKHLWSHLDPEMFLGGYHVSGQVSGFAAFPRTGSLGLQAVVNDAGYMCEVSVGPTINVKTVKLSAFGMVGCNVLEVKRALVDEFRTEQVEELQKRRDQGLPPPPNTF